MICGIRWAGVVAGVFVLLAPGQSPVDQLAQRRAVGLPIHVAGTDGLPVPARLARKHSSPRANGRADPSRSPATTTPTLSRPILIATSSHRSSRTSRDATPRRRHHGHRSGTRRRPARHRLRQPAGERGPTPQSWGRHDSHSHDEPCGGCRPRRLGQLNRRGRPQDLSPDEAHDRWFVGGRASVCWAVAV